MVEVMVHEEAPVVLANTAIQRVVVVVVAVVLGNVSAVVDAVLHPEIPYFDPEHLVVGGATALVGATLSFLLLRSVRRLRRARITIDSLETLLPICASCKRIRRPGADPHATESWQAIESYITEKTRTEFSHGICPECIAVLYAEQEPRIKRGTES